MSGWMPSSTDSTTALQGAKGIVKPYQNACSWIKVGFMV